MDSSVLKQTTDTFIQALNDALTETASFLPNLILAIIVFTVGVVIASLVKNLLTRVLLTVGFEDWLSKTVIPEALKSSGAKLTTSSLIGELVRWFIVLLFLIPVVDMLGLGAVNQVLTDILLYIPNVVVAVIIVAIGAVFANIAKDLVAASVASVGAQAASVIAQVARWSILIFALLAALNQLGVATELIRIIFTGLVAMVAIAGGLAFGLGGKETAERLLKTMRKDWLNEKD